MRLAEEYWNKFIESFLTVLRNDSQADLLNAWDSKTNRTDYYVNKVFPRIKPMMGLDSKEELFNVDYVYYDEEKGIKIPAIFIESENDPDSADHELRKLCCLSCPLTVLFTVVEWDKMQYPTTSRKAELLGKWEEIIEAHFSAFKTDGILSIIVGEYGSDKILRFYIRKYLRKEPRYKPNEITKEIKKIA